jgi:hypothetical protein
MFFGGRNFLRDLPYSFFPIPQGKTESVVQPSPIDLPPSFLTFHTPASSGVWGLNHRDAQAFCLCRHLNAIGRLKYVDNIQDVLLQVHRDLETPYSANALVQSNERQYGHRTATVAIQRTDKSYG